MTRTWLITGSTRGFGRELAVAALEHNDNVVATARRPEQLDDLARDYGDRVRTVGLDVTDRAAARATVHLAVDEFGSLDVVVNNAGAVESAANSFRARAREAERWSAVSRSADFGAAPVPVAAALGS